MGNSYSNPFTATLKGILNLFESKQPIGVLGPNDRIDGKTCLVTGANSGLGFAIAIQLAQRGGRVIMACRSGIPEAGESVKKESGSDLIEMVKVDLSDIDSIHELGDQLLDRDIRLDILVCNAGVVPAGSRKTKQGFDEMFMVNYLANYIFLNRIWTDGLLNRNADNLPRVVVISSESHRSGTDLDLDGLGVYSEYKMGKVVGLYGYYKLLLNTMVTQLSRGWNIAHNTHVSVHLICPGAVNSKIAKEAPVLVQPLLKLVFGLFFQRPAVAAKPVVYLCCSPEIEGKTDIYLHMSTAKEMDSRATDQEIGTALITRTAELVAPFDQAGSLS